MDTRSKLAQTMCELLNDSNNTTQMEHVNQNIG